MFDALDPSVTVPANANMTPTAKPKRVLFKAADGPELVGTLFRPAQAPRAVVVLSSATGVPQGFYAHFARWAAQECGLAVLTYDYRATGLSATTSMRTARADMIDWGQSDPQAARAAARREFPGVPIWAMGHSLGGMLVPMQADRTDLARVITVASGMAHVRDHPWPYRATALAFWYAIGPIATTLMGYLPGRRIGFGSDLPAAAYWQWRRWCTRDGAFLPDVGTRLPTPEWGAGDAPVHMVSLRDDELVPTKCVRRLAEVYVGGDVDVIEIDPAALGMGKVGHLGMFARRNQALWPTLLGES